MNRITDFCVGYVILPGRKRGSVLFIDLFYVLHEIGNRNMLRAGIFTLVALYTIAGLSMIGRQVHIIDKLAGNVAGASSFGTVIEGKVIRNGNILWTLFNAIAADGTGYRRVGIEYLCYLLDDLVFLLIKGLKMFESGHVVFKLQHSIHAAEDHHYAFLTGNEAKSPGRNRSLGPIYFHQLFSRIGNSCQISPFARFHDNNRQIMFPGDLITMP